MKLLDRPLPSRLAAIGSYNRVLYKILKRQLLCWQQHPKADKSGAVSNRQSIEALDLSFGSSQKAQFFAAIILWQDVLGAPMLAAQTGLTDSRTRQADCGGKLRPESPYL